MTRNYRLRRILAPTAGLIKAIGALVLGLFLLAVGCGLSFNRLILPAFQWASHICSQAIGVFFPPQEIDLVKWFLGLPLMIVAAYLIVQSLRYALSHVVETLSPGLKSGKADVYFRRQQLAQGPRIVVIGGGTGLSTLLRGVKHHTSNITAIVTVTDDGGSSGRLIKDKSMIPPGDIRNCLVALADAEKSMTDLFQHRFKDDSGSLSGHSMGNLLIAALVDQASGDFEKAIEIASDVLAIRGRVVPSTLAHVRLRAELENGMEICGETAIVNSGSRIKRIYLDPIDCEPTREAIEAIRTADLICIGPGSVFTSIIPNLIVPGLMDAIRQSTAKKVYICNVMTQPGESDSFTASEHVTAILNNVQGRVFDIVLVNNGVPTGEALQRYRDSGQHRVDPDVDRIRAMGLRVIQGNFMSETDVVRHDPMKVAARVVALVR
jgi:uncharacterized cofD-like protein